MARPMSWSKVKRQARPEASGIWTSRPQTEMVVGVGRVGVGRAEEGEPFVGVGGRGFVEGVVVDWGVGVVSWGLLIEGLWGWERRGG